MSRETTSHFTPQLTTTDWGGEWKELQKARRAADNAAFWDERSKTFGGKHEKERMSPYVEQFLELAQIQPTETVFDMGCGNGALACPLAQAGHSVIAADFSQGMLDALRNKCEQSHISGVETVQMSWEDNWADFGIEPDCVDVAIASRSIVTADLSDSLMRLTRVARHRVCITLPTGSSPRSDEQILNAIGVQGRVGRDYLYAFMILANKGYYPTLRYISSERNSTYESKQDALEHLGKMITDMQGSLLDEDETNQALRKLSDWLDDNLVENEHAGKFDPNEDETQKRLRLATPRMTRWAFISWDVADRK